MGMKSWWLSMPLRLLVSLFFTTALLLVVLLGLYASLGRLYMPKLAGQGPVIQAYLAENVPFPVQFDAVEGDWQQLSPIILLRGLRADVPVKGTIWHFSARDVAIELDVIRSLIRRQPVLRDIHIDGGAVTMSGPPLVFLAPATDAADRPQTALSEVLASAFSLGVVRMSNSRIEMNMPGIGQPLVLMLSLQLEHRGNFRRLRADIALGENAPGRIGVLLEANQSMIGALNTIDAYVRWDQVPLNRWLQGMAWEGRVPRITEAFSGQLWGRWVPGAEIRLHGRVAAPVIAWQRHGEAWPVLEDFAADFLLERSRDQRWQLQVPDVQFTCGGVASPLQSLVAEYRAGAPLRLSLGRLDLPATRRLLAALRPAASGLHGVLATLDPQGALAPLVLDLQREPAGKLAWRLRAGLQDVAVSSWKGTPAATGVNGYLDMGPQGGFVDLDSRAFSMAFPTVYEQPMQFTAARARVGWQLEPDRVTVASSLITLESPEGNAQGLLSLDLPKRHDADHASWMSLVIGLTDAPAAARNKYIPKTLAPGLKRWLDASIGPGHVRRGGFIFDGPLERHARGPVVQLFLDVEDTALRFDPRWPALQGIDGRLLVDDGEVTVWAKQARILGSRAQPVRVRVGHAGDGPLLLAVQGNLAGPTQDVLRLLQESPLRKAVGDTFQGWSAKGDFAGRLDLLVPLAGAEPAQVEVDARIDGNRLRLGGQGLQFEAVSGPLHFRSDSGLQSPGLTASLWGEPLALRIDSQALPAGTGTRVQAHGKVRVEGLKDWLDWPWLRFASGAAELDADINLQPGTPASLRLLSDLRGVTIDLPAPYRKEAGSAWPFRATVPLGGELPMMDFVVGPNLRVAALREDGAMRVALALGNVPFRAPQQAGVTVYGRLPHFDWAEWQQPLQRLIDDFARAAGKDPQDASPAAFRVSGLYADSVHIFGQSYASLVATVRQEEQRWWVGVRSENLIGKVGLPQADGEPFLVQLDRLALPADALGGKKTTTPAPAEAPAPDPLQDLDWSGWPPLQVDIRRLWVGSQDFGHWQFAVQPSPERLRIERLQADAELLRIDADGGGAWMDWQRHPDGRQETRLHAALLIHDVDAALNALGYDPGITAREAVMAFDLHWPAAPLSVNAAQLAGTTSFHFTDGYLKTGNRTQTGMLKVLSVFNLDMILRRIQLDFSDLYKEGLAFDDSKAGLVLQDGWITIAEPLTIRGPSSHFMLEGRVDMVNDVLDNRLTVTLPVSNSLPWLAAIAGGLPAAVGVYVASKVLEKQVNSFTTLVYEVTGSRTDPQVRFQRLFDAQALLPKMPAFLVPRSRSGPVAPESTGNGTVAAPAAPAATAGETP